MDILKISLCQIQSLPSRNSWDHRSCMKQKFVNGKINSVSFKANSSVHLVKATSSGDKGGGSDQTKTGASILGGFGLFGYLFKVGLDVLTKQKEEIEDIGKKIDNAADVADKVAETLEKVAKSSEEIADSVEGESPKDGKIYKAAEMVDKISVTLAKDARIVENEAEKVEATVKAIDEAVEKSDSIAEEISSAVIAAENSSRQSVNTKKT